MLKGTNVSSGIGIGKAVIVEEKELVIRREAVADAAAEVERFKGALDTTLKKTEELAADLATRDHAGPYDASDGSDADRRD